jgi:hypothetical protein
VALKSQLVKHMVMDPMVWTLIGTVILVQLTMSQVSWRSYMFVIVTMGMSKFTQQMVQVWIFVMLVIL